MPAAVIKTTSFAGSSNLYRKDSTGLAAQIRGLAVDNARRVMENAGVPDLTDSSGGAANASLAAVAMTIPTAAFDATSAGGAQLTASNAAFVKFENAGRVLTNSINNARARLGLSVMSAASGTQVTANTIPAQDLSVATANGTAAIDYATGIAAMKAIKKNVYRLYRGLNGVLKAMGEPPVTYTLIKEANFPADVNLTAITAASASATGASSVSKTVMDAFLVAVAGNLATMASLWNFTMYQGGLSDLTDSSGGTASTTTVVAQTLPTAVPGAATTSAPKAGFDAQLAIIANNVATLAARSNLLIAHFGGTRLTDSSGGTASATTVAAMSNNLTAVDGSTGTVAVDQATALARMATVRDDLADLTTAVNTLTGYFGLQPLTNSLGVTGNTTIAAITATGTGVGGGGNVTLLDTAVDTWLGQVMNNIATLTAKLNAMTGADAPAKPLSVVAG